METPDYFPKSFPPEDFPRYQWSQRPEGLPPDVWTTETTHRDGQQGGLPFDTDFGLKVFDVLSRFTGRSGAIRQASSSFITRAIERWSRPRSNSGVMAVLSNRQPGSALR